MSVPSFHDYKLFNVLSDWIYQGEFFTNWGINNGPAERRNVNFFLYPINVLADLAIGAGSHSQDNKVLK